MVCGRFKVISTEILQDIWIIIRVYPYTLVGPRAINVNYIKTQLDI